MDEGGAMFATMVFGFFLGCFIGSHWSDGWWQAEAIDRGLALYCPISGDWAFVGECEVKP